MVCCFPSVSRVVALPSPAAEKEEEEEEEDEEFKPVARKAAAFPPDLVSPKAGTPGVGFGQKVRVYVIYWCWRRGLCGVSGGLVVLWGGLVSRLM